jgi:uncharacterized protein (TIGR02246 family)
VREALLLIGLFFLAPLSFGTGQARPADEQAVRQVIQETGDALNARDWDGAAAVFAEDGDVVLPRSPRVSGRSAIRTLWQERWSGAPAERKITLSVRSLRFLAPDVAIADSNAEFTAGEPTRDRATYVIVRNAGTWRVAALRVMDAEEF